MTDPTPDPAPAPAAAWYTSPVQLAQVTSLMATAVALFPNVAARFGLKTSDDVQHLVALIAGVAGFAVNVYGIYKRAQSKLQPLALTQAKADAHPANVAAAATAVVAEAAKQPAPVTIQPTPGTPWGK